ncbi:MAG: MmcQ/YjbR family DNA-binding protein [Treponema sp.]|nr:MmcQ/YjbR family DNA-binding protein [Treponema sp.]
MTYPHILTTAIPQNDKLLAYGFTQSGGNLVLGKDIAEGDFYVRITLSEKDLSAEVFESGTDEKYVLFDVASAHGAFVAQIRNEVRQVIDDILEECFVSGDIKEKYEDFLHEHFGAAGDNPWEDDADSTVYRCPNGKWFALVMRIKFKNLGFASEEPVWAVNLKAEDAKSVVDGKSIFPAYHMNKKYWITVLLSAVTDFENLCKLTEESFNLVRGKKGHV